MRSDDYKFLTHQASSLPFSPFSVGWEAGVVELTLQWLRVSPSELKGKRAFRGSSIQRQIPPQWHLKPLPKPEDSTLRRPQ